MEKQIFTSQRFTIPKIALYFFLFLILLFIALIPFSSVTRVSNGQDGSIGFSMMLLTILSMVFYVYRNYIIKINDKKITVYFPFKIKRKTIDLQEISHYKSQKIKDYEDGSITQYQIISLYKNNKTILEINSLSYRNSDELFKKLVANLNENVIKLKK